MIERIDFPYKSMSRDPIYLLALTDRLGFKTQYFKTKTLTGKTKTKTKTQTLKTKTKTLTGKTKLVG